MNYHKHIDSPVGKIKLVASDKGLTAVTWKTEDVDGAETTSIENNGYPILLEAEKQLTEYFEKKRSEFTVPLDFTGTPFQVMVWEALLTIPFGATRSYGQIARQINNPGSVRAVGGAANKNPIPVIVPCHRVIGSSGKLVGFASGLAKKTWLLQNEITKKELLLF